MAITREHFGFAKSGEAVSLFTLTNAQGAAARVLSYGCVLQSLSVPAREGLRDVCLGFDSLEEYESKGGCFGAVCGRYANRIRAGRFSLNGREYFVSLNAGGRHHIHGGVRGFHKQVWQAEAEGTVLRLRRRSPDGEEGYPGNLDVTVEYELDDANALHIRYRVGTDADTVLNLTNHSYFNLNGHGSGPVMDHTLRLAASAITAVDESGMPDGTLLPVEGTPFDFRGAKPLGRDIDSGHPQLLLGRGYDHNFVLDGRGQRTIGELRAGDGSLTMTVDTDQPGVQLYTANNLSGLEGKGGAVYGRRSAVCLETQHYPNSPEHAHFPSTVLRRGEVFTSETIYRFRRED